MHRLVRSCSVIALVVTSLVGCADADSAQTSNPLPASTGLGRTSPHAPSTRAASSPTPVAGSASPAVVGQKRYATVGSLRQAFSAAGGHCIGWRQTNEVKTAAQSGRCANDNVLMTFNNITSRNCIVAFLGTFGTAADPVKLVVGPNWIINDPSAVPLALQLGGTIVTSTGT